MHTRTYTHNRDKKEFLLSHSFIQESLIGPVMIGPAHLNVAFSDWTWIVMARSTAAGSSFAMFGYGNVTLCVGTSIMASTCRQSQEKPHPPQKSGKRGKTYRVSQRTPAQQHVRERNTHEWPDEKKQHKWHSDHSEMTHEAVQPQTANSATMCRDAKANKLASNQLLLMHPHPNPLSLSTKPGKAQH